MRGRRQHRRPGHLRRRHRDARPAVRPLPARSPGDRGACRPSARRTLSDRLRRYARQRSRRPAFGEFHQYPTQRAAAQAGRPLRLRIRVPSFDAVCRMLQAGMWVGMLPHKVYESLWRPLGLVAVELTDESARRRSQDRRARRRSAPARQPSVVQSPGHGRGGPALPDVVVRREIGGGHRRRHGRWPPCTADHPGTIPAGRLARRPDGRSRITVGLRRGATSRLQDFAGHADPRTTLTDIRSRDRLSKSPAYVLKY